MSNKKKLWKIHAWLGLYVGIMILVLSITGSVIVFRYELDKLLNPKLFKVSEATTPYSLDELSQNILNEYPKYYLHHFKYKGDGEIIEVKIKPIHQTEDYDKSEDVDIYVNAANGEINGARSPETGLLHWITKLHTNLLAGKVGRFIVGTFALALLIMLIVGLMIHGSFMKRKRFTQIRYGEGARKVSADWHKLLGITSVPFNLLWAITGFALAFLPDILDATIGKPEVSYAQPTLLEKPIKIENFSYDNIAKTVIQNYPDGKIISIKEAHDDKKYMEVKLDFQKPLIKDDAAKLYIDKEKQEIISHFDPHTASLGAKLFYSQNPLHFGTFGGVWSKIIYSIFGLSSGALFVTGFVVYFKRRKKEVVHLP